MLQLPDSIHILHPFLEAQAEYYLVGGAVRDSLLGHNTKDLDIVCSGDTRVIARNIANAKHGSYFVLDEERNTCRVIIRSPAEERIVFDFVQMRRSILNDLSERDFTINAMAIDLRKMETVIDPLDGKRDLQERWLRPCRTTSFVDDPVRVIRAIRYSVNLGLKIESSTQTLIYGAVKGLAKVSVERRRDELFKTFENDRSYISLELLKTFGVLPFLGLEGNWESIQSFRCLKQYEMLTSILLKLRPVESTEFFLVPGFQDRFSKFLNTYSSLLLHQNSFNRLLLQLDKYCAVLWGKGKYSSESIKSGLALSRSESERVALLVNNSKRFLELTQHEQPLDRRMAYRFFLELGSAGLSLILLSMADLISKTASEINHETWLKALSIGESLVSFWVDHPEVIDPSPLLRGEELMSEFSLIPGPMIGILLERLKEEQAAGTIENRKQALEWVEKEIKLGKSLQPKCIGV
jgi:poly(A) polymerase